jgi:hypothetical protein
MDIISELKSIFKALIGRPIISMSFLPPERVPPRDQRFVSSSP